MSPNIQVSLQRRFLAIGARRSASVAVCALLGALALSGCRAEEQNRITEFKKGVYQGAPDQSLDEETRRALHERSRRQRFSN